MLSLFARESCHPSSTKDDAWKLETRSLATASVVVVCPAEHPFGPLSVSQVLGGFFGSIILWRVLGRARQAVA